MQPNRVEQGVCIEILQCNEHIFQVLDPGVHYTTTPNRVEQEPAGKSCYESRVILQLLLFSLYLTVEIAIIVG